METTMNVLLILLQSFTMDFLQVCCFWRLHFSSVTFVYFFLVLQLSDCSFPT